MSVIYFWQVSRILGVLKDAQTPQSPPLAGDDVIRLSIGLEDSTDLINDLKYAFST